MKNNRLKWFILLASILVMINTSCKKDEVEEPVTKDIYLGLILPLDIERAVHMTYSVKTSIDAINEKGSGNSSNKSQSVAFF